MSEWSEFARIAKLFKNELALRVRVWVRGLWLLTFAPEYGLSYSWATLALAVS